MSYLVTALSYKSSLSETLRGNTGSKDDHVPQASCLRAKTQTCQYRCRTPVRIGRCGIATTVRFSNSLPEATECYSPLSLLRLMLIFLRADILPRPSGMMPADTRRCQVLTTHGERFAVEKQKTVDSNAKVCFSRHSCRFARLDNVDTTRIEHMEMT